jgi:hypothetical protein
MTRDTRKALQKQQAELIRALQGRIGVPAGLDESKIAVAVQSLLRKRGNEIKAAWPALAEYLGRRFRNLFSVFAASQTTPQSDAVIDGYLFAVWLSSRERLPAEVILAVRRYESQCSGKPRIWWQPDRRKVMIVWRWRGRAHSATLG